MALDGATSSSCSGGSAQLPDAVALGLRQRGRGGKGAGDAAPYGKGKADGQRALCSGDYYDDCDLYAVKVWPRCRAGGAL